MSNDRLIAIAQIVLSILFLTYTGAVVLIYELGLSHLTESQDKSFANQINWLTTASMIILYFWFQRQRTAGIPADTTTTSTTSPDGAQTTTATISSTPKTVNPGGNASD